MIKLNDKDTGAIIGNIDQAQLQFLIDELEEEYKNQEDRDYYINQAQLDIFKEKGGNAELISMLETALGNRDGMEIVWSES